MSLGFVSSRFFAPHPPRRCGGGVAKQYRTVLQEPRFGGSFCPDLWRSVPCNTHACPQVCGVGEWSDWSECSVRYECES